MKRSKVEGFSLAACRKDRKKRDAFLRHQQEEVDRAIGELKSRGFFPRVQWFFVKNRRLAEVTAFRFLEKFWAKQQEMKKRSVTNAV